MSYLRKVAKNFKWKHTIVYLLLAAVLLLTATLWSVGVMKRSTATMLNQIGYSIILAVSLNIVVGFLGELSLGHAGFMCIGAYLGTFLYNHLIVIVPSKLFCLIICMAFGGLAAALGGMLVGLPAMRLKGDYLAIVTLAFNEIIGNLFKNIPLFGGGTGLPNQAPYGYHLFIVTFVTVIFMLFVLQNLIRSKHGRAITAIRDNEIAARAMGINVTYYKLFAFTIAAFFAGIAGVLYGAAVSPVKYTNFTFNYSIEILVMVVLGGIGSINGSIIAAAFITYLNLTLTNQLSGDLAALKNLVYALILILVVIFHNAPALQKYRDRFSLTRLSRKLFAKKSADITDDSASWDRIPTKIPMDELLSVDLKSQNENPDSTIPGDRSDHE